MSDKPAMPETKVLAIASHVSTQTLSDGAYLLITTRGSLWALGCEVSAIHTVNISNHTGYRQTSGRKATASEIRELFAGLKHSHLADFDVLLSGYAPGAEAVEAVGEIARTLKTDRESQGRQFFWVMDPVMGDNGRLYVNEDVVPAYKALLPSADLILPNQFETETLSGTKITDLPSLLSAISSLHSTYKIPHIIVTSVRFPLGTSTSTEQQQHDPSSSTSSAQLPTLSIIGSTIRRADSSPRLFRITVPDLDVFFSGTGDMFAALMVARLRQICAEDGLCAQNPSGSGCGSGSGSNDGPAWLCPDSVEPLQTPLARAAELVCASMSVVLSKTKACMDAEIASTATAAARAGTGAATGSGPAAESELDLHLRKTKAAEVRVVRFQKDLQNPVVVYKAEEVSA